MKILIPGGSGFIGRYLADDLAKHHEVHIIGFQENTDCVTSFSGKMMPYCHCDHSVDQIDQIIKEIRPDALINLAARRLDPKDNDPGSYYVNLHLSANIFEACLRNALNNVINISTIGVYSTLNAIPWHESDTPAPSNFYALSKQWAENAADFYNRKGMNIKTLRLAQVIGLGEREGYLLQVLLNNAMQGLPITVFGQCLGKRHYVYVKDVVAAINATLMKLDVSGIFNIGMSNIYGFDELAATINRVFGNKSEIIFNKEAKADENIYHMSIEKARRELDWNPRYDLYETYVDIKHDLGSSHS